MIIFTPKNTIYNKDIMLYPKNLGDALTQTMNCFLGEKRRFLQHLQITFKKVKYSKIL